MKLVLENICFSYTSSTRVLSEVTLAPHPGGVTALLGSNGSGKSTLLKIISGMYRPDSGKAEIDSIPIASLPGRIRAANIAMIRQYPVNPGAYTVAEIIAMGCYHRTPRNSRLPDKEKQLLDSVLELAGIYHLRNRRCNELSGGELQLVMAAQSFMQ